MKLLKFFSFLVFNLSFYALKKEIIDDENKLIKDEIKELIPYFYNKYESFEEEIAECKKNLPLIKLKKIEKFLKDNVFKKDFKLKLSYEIFKIKFCKNKDFEENDLSVFVGTRFHANIIQMYVTNHFNKCLKASLSINQWKEFSKDCLSVLKKINKKKAKEIEKKIKLIVYEYDLKNNFNKNSCIFFVNRFNKNIISIKNNESNVDFEYYSLIEFMLAQKDEELKKDAEKLFEEMKKKYLNSKLVKECEKLLKK